MGKNKNKEPWEKFYGVTSVGERGQVVIPSEVRKKYKISKGEKFLVVGFKEDVISLLRMSKAKNIIGNLMKEVGFTSEDLNK